MKFTLLFSFLFLVFTIKAQKQNTPVEFIYKVTETDSLSAFVFYPDNILEKESIPAVAIFHGGGWAMGKPSWGFGYAADYAEKGLVAISVQYRLSDQKSITPIDAMEDAQDFFLWLRENAASMKVHRDSIAAFGWSAGGHLVSSASVFPKYSTDSSFNSSPNVLILQSPAVSPVNDTWFTQLLLDRGEAKNYSPAQHIKENMPPTIIVVGKEDTVTPACYSELFRDNMLQKQNLCELYIYEGVGHLFTPAHLSDKGYPQPDPEVSKKAFAQVDKFLMALGYF